MSSGDRDPFFETFSAGLACGGKCPDIPFLLGAVADMDWAITAVEIKRIKEKLGLEYPIYDAIAFLSVDAKVTGCS